MATFVPSSALTPDERKLAHSRKCWVLFHVEHDKLTVCVGNVTVWRGLYRGAPTALMPSCMYVSPAGLIWLSFFKPSSIFDLWSRGKKKNGTAQFQQKWKRDPFLNDLKLVVFFFFFFRKEDDERTCLRLVEVSRRLWPKRRCRKPSSWDWNTQTHTHTQHVDLTCSTRSNFKKLKNDTFLKIWAKTAYDAMN